MTPQHSSIIVATVAFAAALGAPALAQSGVGVTIDGSPVNVAPAPIIEDGRVFVPLRGVFERLGASVVYSNGLITATGNGREISLNIGSTHAQVDGAPQTVDIAPFIVGDSTYVPLRFISQALGANVSWNNDDRVVAIDDGSAPDQSYQPEASVPISADDADVYADQAPPPLPDYTVPPVPAPNDQWMPGYWAWGNAGYYWVPGTWVAAPQPGYVWTPGYWAADGSRFQFHAGFWGLAIGFYGGINYGGGYFGHGYAGGRWSGNTFVYNTAVVRVNTTVVRNTYVDRTVVENRPETRVSYNGGPHGVEAAPTAHERQALAGRRVAMTTVQREHVQTAARNTQLRDTVNAGAPPVAAVAHPLVPAHPAAYAAPAAPQHALPQQHPTYAQPQHPTYAQPQQRPGYAQPRPAPQQQHRPGPQPHADHTEQPR